MKADGWHSAERIFPPETGGISGQSAHSMMPSHPVGWWIGSLPIGRYKPLILHEGGGAKLNSWPDGRQKWVAARQQLPDLFPRDSVNPYMRTG